jgi:hypothetical protein
VTIRERVERTRLGLEIVAVASALLWGLSVSIAIVIAAALVNAFAALPAPIANVVRASAILIGLSVVALNLWKARFAWTLDRVALWIEERAPELQYSLVTAVDERYSSRVSAAAEPLVAKVNTAGLVRDTALRSVGPPAIALAAVLALSAFVPERWKESFTAEGSVFGNPANAFLAGSRLRPLSARIIPPAYTGLRTETLEEPATLAGIQGSRIVIEGSGSPRGIAAQMSSAGGRRSTLAISGNGDGWSAAISMADTIPFLIELTDRHYKRAIVVNPRADAEPTVKLRLPARDTALRTPSGNLQLDADVADDVGLGSAQFEYIISSGSEETFSFRQGALGAARFNGRKNGKISISVPYSFFKLGEGDRISVRAVASDLNSLTGPGRGFSETRTIRVARKDEYDSLSVEAAAPTADTALLSLRMVIVETEKLEAERRKIGRDTLVARSRTLARQTDRIQDEVLPLFKEEGTGEPQVTMDTEPTERAVPVTAGLRSAIDALGQASRDLDVADPGAAVPQLYKAYKALQALRTFKRYYLRGAIRPVIVDIQRVRLTGKTKGTAAPMTGRAVASSERDRMRMEYSSAIEQLRTAPSKAVTMLTMLRVESLRNFPALAAAIDDALTAIGRGGDVTQPLLRVRRLLEGAPVITDSIPLWSGGW